MSSGGGTSTICGTGFRSKEALKAGGDFEGGGTFRISGILAVLVLFIISSLLKIESKVVDGTEELMVAEEKDASRPAGLEKFVAAAFPTLDELAGSFNVCARLVTSIEAKFGRGGMAGTFDSGDSDLLPDGLSAAALRAARCA